jgi:hypothetical protein
MVVSEEPGMSSTEKLRMRWDSQDFANFDYLAAVVALVPRRTGSHTYGLQYLQLFTEPIPRLLWRGKPAGAPIRLMNLNQHANFLGLTMSLPGDGWISGGWIGVILTMTLAGLATGLGHRGYWRNRGHPVLALLYMTFLGVSPNWFRDGGISVFKFLFFTWLPLLIWLGVLWVSGGRLMPVATIILRPGASVRLIQSESQNGGHACVVGRAH